MSETTPDGETTTQMLARLLDEALEALKDAPGHIVMRSGYCAKCEGGCFKVMTNPPPPLVPHPWDRTADRDRNTEAAQRFARVQGIAVTPRKPQ